MLHNTCGNFSGPLSQANQSQQRNSERRVSGCVLRHKRRHNNWKLLLANEAGVVGYFLVPFHSIATHFHYVQIFLDIILNRVKYRLLIFCALWVCHVIDNHYFNFNS